MMRLTNYLRKAIFTGLANSFGSALVSIAFIPLIIKRVGMEKYGTWATLFIFVGLSSVLNIGLSKALVYSIPRQNSQNQMNEVYSAGFCLNILVVLLVAIVGSIVYCSGANVWGNNESISYELGRQILLGGLIVTCCSVVTSFYCSVLEASYEIHLVNIGFLILTIMNYSCVYTLSFFTQEIQYFIICTAGVYVTMLVFHIFLVIRYTEVSLCTFEQCRFRQIAKKTFEFFSVGILNTLAQPVNRYLLIILTVDAKVYGIFDIALKIAMMARCCLGAFALPLFSVFAGYGRAGISKIKQILNYYLVGLGAGYVVGCILFLMAGKHILKAFVETDSSHLFYTSFILLSGIALYGVAEPFVRAFLALGDLRLSFNINAVQVALNLSLILLLAKLAPLYRFSLAYSMSFSTAAIVNIVMFKYKYSDCPEGLCQDCDDKAGLADRT